MPCPSILDNVSYANTVQSRFSDTFGLRKKLSLNRIMSLNRMLLCSKMKNGLCKIVTKSQVVTKFNVTKSRLHCSINQVAYKWFISRISQTYNKIDGNTVICQILHKMVKKEVSEILKIIICSLNF